MTEPTTYELDDLQVGLDDGLDSSPCMYVFKSVLAKLVSAARQLHALREGSGITPQHRSLLEETAEWLEDDGIKKSAEAIDAALQALDSISLRLSESEKKSKEWDEWAKQLMEDEGVAYSGNRGYDISRLITGLANRAEDAESRLAAKERKCGWQSMDTAPKDDRILACEEGECFIVWWSPANCWVDSDGPMDPDYWMPLPEPPAKRGGAAMICPNCGSTMNEGDPCPECDHHDGDEGCDCQTCQHTWDDLDGDQIGEGEQT